jgi:hypothetical protein
MTLEIQYGNFTKTKKASARRHAAPKLPADSDWLRGITPDIGGAT